MGSTAQHKCACQVWNTQAHQGTCLVQLQACMPCHAFVTCLGAMCVSAALTCSLCKSACVCCWSVLRDGVLIATLLAHDSRSVAATFQTTLLTNFCLLQSNIDNTTNWALSDEEYKAITSIKHQLRLLDGCPWLHEVGPYRYSFPY
jgi:hypothetical protein